MAVPARGADSDITVDPLVGTPDTAFHVEVPAAFAIRQLRDRYWFILHGPGGRRCEGTVTDRVGVTPTRRAKAVAVDLPGVRIVTSRQIVPGPWCEGTFTGRVEFRDWRPRLQRYVVHRIGSFSVQVQAEQTN
ncbi:MAG TPA: hypothetical protein VF066_15265 [Thermoleophilaceae bacterium]